MPSCFNLFFKKNLLRELLPNVPLLLTQNFIFVKLPILEKTYALP